MPRIPGVSHRCAIRALEKAGFRVLRGGRMHVVLSDGDRFLTIARNDPVNACTMGGIVADAGLDVDVFEKLL